MAVIPLREGMLVAPSETPQNVHDVLDEAKAAANGETHIAVACVLIDAQGRALTRTWWAEGNYYTLLGAIDDAKHQMRTHADR